MPLRSVPSSKVPHSRAAPWPWPSPFCQGLSQNLWPRPYCLVNPLVQVCPFSSVCPKIYSPGLKEKTMAGGDRLSLSRPRGSTNALHIGRTAKECRPKKRTPKGRTPKERSKTSKERTPKECTSKECTPKLESSKSRGFDLSSALYRVLRFPTPFLPIAYENEGL